MNLRKAKQTYMARCEEYEKAKTAACRAEEEGGGSTAKSVEKKKRLEEEARNKVVTSPLSIGAIISVSCSSSSLWLYFSSIM